MKMPASHIQGPFLVRVGEYEGLEPQLTDLMCPSLQEARRLCLEEIDDRGCGASTWAGGEVLDEATKQCVAVVSYNGRVWWPGKKNPEGLFVPDQNLEFDLDA